MPVYFGAETIGPLAQRLTRTFSDHGAWEVIFVVDGCEDNSWDTVVGLARHDDRVRGLELDRNCGQANATLAGIRGASFDTIVTMDDDLQHRPETVPALLAALTPDVDLVYGRPTSDEHNWWRNASSRIVKAAISVWSGRGRIVRDASAFRAFRTSLREGFTGVNDPNLAIDALLSVVTSRYITCNVPMDQRRTGSSNYTFLALVRHSRELANGYRRSSPVSADRFGGSGARPAYTVRRSVGVDLGSAGQ